MFWHRPAVTVLAGALVLSAGCGWAKRKPYGNDPLVRNQQPIIGRLPPNAGVTGSTPAEPYPPPRPILPVDPMYARGADSGTPNPSTPAPAIRQERPFAGPATGTSPGVPVSRPIGDQRSNGREPLPVPRPIPETPGPLPLPEAIAPAGPQ